MRINKVKVTKAGKIHIEYQERKGDSWDDYSMKCSERALPKFYELFGELKQHMNDICEFPEEFVDRLTVRGVSFSYGGEREVMGAVLSGFLTLNMSVAPLNINTPHKIQEPYSEKAEPIEEMLLSDELVNLLTDLQKETIRYIKGERAQGKLA